MSERQQILYLWLSEGALDTPVVGWAFHDGAAGFGPALPDEEPPYGTGVAALQDGWMLLQSPALQPLAGDAAHRPGYLASEFVFERRIAVDD